MTAPRCCRTQIIRIQLSPPPLPTGRCQARKRKIHNRFCPRTKRMDALVNPKKKKKIVPERGAIQGEAARLPVAETNLGSVGVRARQGPGRDSGRSALAPHSGVRMRRRQSPLAHRVRGGVRALQRYETEPRSIRKTLTHRWENRGGGENAARKWACLESLIGPAEEGTKPPCPMGGRKSPLSIASSPPPPFAISARALVF